MVSGQNRTFLFLQGPHGPFFNRLAKMLRAAGADVWRVAFNAGDAFFRRDKRSLIPFRDPVDAWTERSGAGAGSPDVEGIVTACRDRSRTLRGPSSP